MRQQPKAGRHEKHFNRCFAHLLSSNESQQEIFYFQKKISENACEVAAALQEAEDLVTRLEQALSSPTCSSVGQNIEGATKNCGVIETHVNTQETVRSFVLSSYKYLCCYRCSCCTVCFQTAHLLNNIYLLLSLSAQLLNHPIVYIYIYIL